MAVIDEVTKSNCAEFFLIPQKVMRGTATPSLYQVIDVDYSKIQLGEIVNITYKLTYDYLNWTGPIRVPSVLQYASKLSG